MPFDSFSIGPDVGPWWSMPLLPRVDQLAPVISTLNTFDGGVDGATITVGNSGGASGDAWTFVSIAATGSATYFASGAYRGGMSGRFAIGATAGLVYAEKLTGNNSVGSLYVRLRFRMPVLPPDATGVRFAVVADSGGAFQLDARMTNSGAVELRTGTGTLVGTSSATYSAGQWVDVGLGVPTFSATAGTVEMKLYDASGAVAQTITSAATVDTLRGGGANKLQVGAIRSGITSFTVDVDDVAMSSTEYPVLPVAPLAVAGSAAATSSAAGSLTAVGALTGAASTTPAAAADLTLVSGGTVHAVAGAASSTNSATADLTRVTPLTGATSTVSAASGAVTATLAVTGAASSVPVASAALTRITPVSGAASSTSSVTAALTVTTGPVVHAATGAASTTSVAAGALTLRGALTGAASTTTAAAGAVTLRLTFSAAASSTSLAAAAVGLRSLLTGSAASVTAALGDLTVVQALGAVVLRPDTGTTGRPAAGTTGRPSAGVTTRATGTTVRPYVGTTARP